MKRFKISSCKFGKSKIVTTFALPNKAGLVER
jgi:hypothetical protein